MALFDLANQSNSKHLTGFRTLWGPVQNLDGHTRSCHQMREISCNHSSGTHTLFEWTISRIGDLVGDCFLRYKSYINSPSHIFHDIKLIEYTVGGHVIERYSGQALQMLGTFDPLARPSTYSHTHERAPIDVVVPLRLCTSTGTTHSYLPLIRLGYEEVKVKVQFRRYVENPKLLASMIMLDSGERRMMCVTPCMDLRIVQKNSLSWTGIVLEGQKGTPLIDITQLGGGNVRDVILMISGNGQVFEPLLGMRLLIGEGKVQYEREMRMDGLMARSMIPRQYYGIDVQYSDAPPVYYMPFDHTPLHEFECTSYMNFQGTAPVNLELDLVPGSYRIDIMCRTFNVLRTQEGCGRIALPAGSTQDTIAHAQTPDVIAQNPAVLSALGVMMLNDVSDIDMAEIRKALVDDEIINETCKSQSYKHVTRPILDDAPFHVMPRIQSILDSNEHLYTRSRIIGKCLSVGITDAGMHEYHDETYQEVSVNRGEAYVLLIYMTDVDEGGETVFVSDDNSVELRVKPRAGRAILFPSKTLHRALQVKQGHKIVLATEVEIIKK